MRIFIIVLCVFSTISVFSQIEQQFSGWTQVSTEFEIIKDLEIQVAQMFRFEMLPYEYNQVNTELQGTWKFNKHWKAGAEYRLTSTSKEEQSRFAIFGRYRDGIDDFELQFRSKLQVETSNFGLPETIFRNKALLGYEITKDIMTYVSYELFYELYEVENTFNQYRIEPGIDLRLNKHNHLSLYYIHSRSMNTNNPRIRHISGLSYEYKW